MNRSAFPSVAMSVASALFALTIAACGEPEERAPVEEVRASHQALSITTPTTIAATSPGATFPAIGNQYSASAGRFSTTNALVAYFDGAAREVTLDAVRMDSNGQRVGNAVTVATAIGTQVRPALACNASSCLVAFAKGGKILGVRVDATGTVLDAVPIELGDAPWVVSLAAHDDGANGIIVAWSDRGTSSGTVYTVLSRRLTSAGALVGAAPTILTSAVVSSASVSVAAFGGTAIVAWDDYSGGTVGRIQGARLDMMGASIDPTPLTLADSGSAAERTPRLVVRTSDLVLVYSIGVTVHARTVTLGPTFAVGTQYTLTTGASSGFSFTARSDGATAMYCITGYSTTYYNEISCATIPTTLGNAYPTRYVEYLDAVSSIDALPMNGNRVLVAGVRHGYLPAPFSNGFDVQTSTSWNVLSNLTTGAASARSPVATFAPGGQFGVTFVEDASFAGYGVRATRLSTSGALVDATPRAIATGSTAPAMYTVTRVDSPVIAAVGASYQFMWQESVQSLYGAVTTAVDGVVVDQSPAPAIGFLRRFSSITSPFALVSGPTATSAFSVNTTGELRDRYVTPTTDYAGSLLVSTFTGVRGDGARAVAWRSNGFSVFAQGSTAASFVVLNGADSGGPSVANGTTSTLVVQRNQTSNTVWATLMNASATAVVRPTFVVETGPDVASPVRVVFDGTYYDLVYIRNNRLELTRVSENGDVLDPEPSVLALDALGAQSVPAVTTDRAGKVLIAYETFDAAPAVRATRITTLVLDWAAAGDGDPLGTPCAGAIDCGSALCIDGVCCNTACGFGATNDCQACSVAAGAAVDGTCGPVAQTTVCRASGGACDVAEVCDGSSTLCPVDGFATSGTICGALGSTPCETDQRCTGAGATCPAKVPRPNTTVCRGAAAACDAIEYCNGSSIVCPPDGVSVVNTVCRAAVDTCDQADVCNGISNTCGADLLAPTTKQCRAAAGICDAAEFCSGGSTACPTNVPAAVGKVCRTATAVCDVEEQCDGTAFACPTDAFAPSTSICRDAAGVCDAPEACSGLGPQCPLPDAYRPQGTVCRVAGGVCDIAEVCTGDAVACPSDVRRGAETICRPATNLCDTAETCVSNSINCPKDLTRVDGSGCGNGLVCDGAEVCQDGACVAGETLVCEADSPCLESTGECSIPTNPGGCAVHGGGTPYSGRGLALVAVLCALVVALRRRGVGLGRGVVVAALALGLGGCVCGVGRVTCDNACTDVGYDEENCGGCGVSCGYGQCIEGECVALPTTNIECGADEECRDGNVCNGVERCVSGRCRAGVNLGCDDGSACTTDTCSPAVGSCVSSRATISCQD